MRFIKTTILFTITSFFLLTLTQCKKNGSSTNNPIDTVKPIDTSNKLHFTMLLQDKPLDTIQKYIKGTWKAHYYKGGVANLVFPQPDSIYTIYSYNRVKTMYKTQVGIDTSLSWYKDRCHLCQFGDSTFIYQYFDMNSSPYFKGIHGIFNDTLITYDANGSDPLFYYYTKIK